MKKSVILILIAVYVISIGIVGTIGLNVRVYAPNVKPTSIEITKLTYKDTTLEYKTNDKGLKYFKQIRTTEDFLTFELRYVIGPDDATDKTVIYSFDPENVNIKVDAGMVIISRPADVIEGVPTEVTALIILTPKENASISDTVQVSVLFM